MTISPHRDASDLPDTAWASDELETLGCCPMCHHTSRQLLHENLTDTLFRCAPGRWNLHACSACGTAYLDPRPAAQAIGKAYAKYFTHPDEASTPNEASVQGRSSMARGLRGLARAALNSYRNARWNTTLTPSNRWGRYAVPLVWPVRSLVEQQMRHMPPPPQGRPGRLLDVGCGNGKFLEVAQKAGWAVQGIDFDPIAVAQARSQGLDVRLGGIDQLSEQEQTYDWITCSHVIEHVHAPQALLESMHRLLRSGGTLWLQAPNIDSVGHRVFGTDWIGVDPPRHLSLMTLQGLRSVLQQVGFQTRCCRLPVLSAMAVYAASNALRHGEENAMALPHSRILRLGYVLPALWQNWNLHRAEFHTIIARR